MFSALERALIKDSNVSGEKTGLEEKKQASVEEKTGLDGEKQAFAEEKTGLEEKKQAFAEYLTNMGVSAHTRENILKLYQQFGENVLFARADVMETVGITATPASELLRKMKDSGLIESGENRGKYRFKLQRDSAECRK